ncbi:unnamed protein product [Gongylonema pulchrum]|uniref:Uncharacterized protein n=1 Tax=Gongylonema pulchrum TaxID=637853 RepID=A0A183DX11_9BILA|nr:unnamed protein product [Gongylonema pulchrum]
MDYFAKQRCRNAPAAMASFHLREQFYEYGAAFRCSSFFVHSKCLHLSVNLFFIVRLVNLAIKQARFCGLLSFSTPEKVVKLTEEISFTERLNVTELNTALNQSASGNLCLMVKANALTSDS